MNLKRASWMGGVLILTLVGRPSLATLKIGFHEYVAAVDDVSGTVQRYGQFIVQQQCEGRSESVAPGGAKL